MDKSEGNKVFSIDGRGSFLLVIETQNLAAWMDINNNFTRDVGDESNLWEGVLVQLGHYKSQLDGQDMPAFRQIEFWAGNQHGADISLARFIELEPWISIVGADTTDDFKNPPMTGGKHEEKLKIKKDVLSLDKKLKAFPGGITLWAKHGYDLKVAEPKIHKQYTFKLAHPVYRLTVSFKDVVEPAPNLDGVDMIKIVPQEVESITCGSHQSPPQVP